jgi:hypothetical protein
MFSLGIRELLQARRTIGTALATLEGVQVYLEPLITGVQRRNDISFTGSAASGLSSEDIDITIVSLASQAAQTATPPLVSCIRKAVAWARSANQPVYVLCTEYSSFPCSHGVPNPERCTVSQSPCPF